MWRKHVRTVSFRLVLSSPGSFWSRCLLSAHYDIAPCWNAAERERESRRRRRKEEEERGRFREVRAHMEDIRVPLLPYILGECLQRFSAADPLTGGSVSQRSVQRRQAERCCWAPAHREQSKSQSSFFIWWLKFGQHYLSGYPKWEDRWCSIADLIIIIVFFILFAW